MQSPSQITVNNDTNNKQWEEKNANREDLSTACFAPYILSVTILFAENLPIADITTSDPYVVVRMREKVLGRTKTVKRNHKKPQWNELIPKYPLFDLNNFLEFHIFDEDIGMDDDLMGTVKYDLANIEIGNATQLRLSIENAESYKANATLHLSIKIDRVESLIKIVSIPSRSQVSSDCLDMLSERKTWNASPQIVQDAFRIFSTEDRSTELNNGDMIDLLFDVANLSSQSLAQELIEEQYNNIFHRNQLKLLNASKLCLDDFSLQRHAPLEDNCLQINLSADEKHYILIAFHNRYSMWTWCMWLTLAYNYWNGKCNRNDFPTWAVSLMHSSEIKYASSHQSHHVNPCRMILKIDDFFHLRIEETDYGLLDMESIVLSADSILPKDYCLDIVISDITLDATKTPERAEKRSSFTTFGNTMKTTVTGTVMGITAAATGIASTTFHTAKNLGTGNVVQIAKDAHTGVKFLGSTLVSTVAAVPNVFSNRRDMVLMFKCNIDYGSLGFNSSSGNWYVDFNADELRGRSGNRRATIGTHTIDYPYPAPDVLSLDMMVLHGGEGAVSMVGQSSLRVMDLIRETTTDRDTKNMKNPLQQPSFNFDVVKHDAKKLELLLGLDIAILEARNLAIPLHLHHRNLFATCKLVDEYGHSDSKQSGKEYKTVPIPAAENPEWKRNKFTIPLDEHGSKPRFLRVELLVEEMTSSYSVGAIFVPLEYATIAAAMYTFPIVRNHMHPSCSKFAMERNGIPGYGEVTIELKKTVATSPQINACPSISFTTQLHESNLFTHSWYAECIPSGDIDILEHIHVEVAQISPQHDRLLLLIEDESIEPQTVAQRYYQKRASYERESIQLEVNQLTKAFNEVPVLETEAEIQHAIKPTIIEIPIEFFENIRRQPYPPFDWSDNAFTRPKYSDLLYKKRYKFTKLHEVVVPPGCIWVEDMFHVDTEYANTDTSGWSYAFTFGKLLENYYEHKTVGVASAHTHARRRLWRRQLRAIDDSIGSVEALLRLFNEHNLVGGTDRTATMSRSLSTSPVTPSMDNNTEKHGQSMEQTPVKQLWRQEKYLRSNNHHNLLPTCLERKEEDSPIMIEWDKILSVTVISSSILHLQISIQRFFPDTTAAATPPNQSSGSVLQKFTFRPITMDLFVTNCPATPLKALIEERIQFFRYRDNIITVMKTGALYESHAQSELDDDDSEVPETEELSSGAQLMIELDTELIYLEKQYQHLQVRNMKLLNDYEQRKLKEQLHLLTRRILRIRLYTASMLQIGLPYPVILNESNVRKLMESDFVNAKRIALDSEVLTTGNRIEYLLDMAEKRIRDITLCGWNQALQVPRLIEILSNGYFMEIASLLGKFFEAKYQSSLIGLGNKMELIQTFVKHNNRLEILLESALRPYRYHTSPPAKLSLYLHFPVLLSWYTSVITQEMHSKVDTVVELWKDTTKDTSGEGKNYKYALPWVPSAIRVTDTSSPMKFFSDIPELLMNYLTTYIGLTTDQYTAIEQEIEKARELTLNTVFTESDKVLYDSLHQLKEKMMISFTNAFLYLSEHYLLALLHAKDYLRLLPIPTSTSSISSSKIDRNSIISLKKDNDETSDSNEELEEYLTWVASVCNDVTRVIEKDLILVGTNQKKEGEESSNTTGDIIGKEKAQTMLKQTDQVLYDMTMSAFHMIRSSSIDQFANMLWHYACVEKFEIDLWQPYAFPNAIKTSVFVQAWKQFTQTNHGTSQEKRKSIKLMEGLNKDVPEEIEEEMDWELEQSFLIQQFQCIHEIFLDYQSYFDELTTYLAVFDTLWCTYMLLLFYLLQQLAKVGEVYSLDSKDPSNIYLVQLRIEMTALGKYYYQCLDDLQTTIPSLPSTENLQATELINMLEQWISLLTLDVSDPKLLKAIQELATWNEVEHSNIFADALARGIETCLSLRGIQAFCNPVQQQTLLPHQKKHRTFFDMSKFSGGLPGLPGFHTTSHVVDEGKQNRSSSMDMKTMALEENNNRSPAPAGHITDHTASTTETPVKKRNSVLTFFQGKHDHIKPTSPAVALSPQPPITPSTPEETTRHRTITSEPVDTMEDGSQQDHSIPFDLHTTDDIACIQQLIQDIRVYHIRELWENSTNKSAEMVTEMIHTAIKEELLINQRNKSYSALLSYYSPVCRIFGTNEVSQYSIKTQVLQSSLVNIHQIMKSGKYWIQENVSILPQLTTINKKKRRFFGIPLGGSHDISSNSSSVGSNNILSNSLQILTGTIPLFYKKKKASETIFNTVGAPSAGREGGITGGDFSKARKFKHERKGSIHKRLFHLTRNKPMTAVQLPRDPSIPPDLCIHIVEIRLANLFYLDRLHSPKPYMKLYLQNHSDPSSDASNTPDVVITSVKDGSYSNTILTWTATDEAAENNNNNNALPAQNRKSFQLPIHTIGSSQFHLMIELWYQGHFKDVYIGKITILFSPFDPLQCRQKEFVMENYSKAASKQAEKAGKEGRLKPTLLLSLDYQKK